MVQDTETAKEWPEGRCESVMVNDVPKLSSSWLAIFGLTQDMCTVLTSVAIFFFCDLTNVGLTMALLPLFGIVGVHICADLYHRVEILHDLASRDRMWKA